MLSAVTRAVCLGSGVVMVFKNRGKAIFCRVFFISLLFVTAGGCFSCSKKHTPKVTSKLIIDAPSINDHSYNENAWQGLISFYNDEWGDEKYFGTLYDVVPVAGQGQSVSTLREICAEKTDLLVMVGFVFSDPLRIVAPMYPEQKFLSIDGSIESLSNILCIQFATEEGSYLVGAAVALQAQMDGIPNAQFGFIGGVRSDLIDDFEAGYVAGIRSIIPTAEIYEFYVDSWNAPALAAEKTKKWYDGNVYAVYSAAGGSGNGTIAQAVIHRKQGKNVWAIGVDVDQYAEGFYGVGKSAVLTSMTKNIDAAIVHGLKLVEKNAFVSGLKVLGLQEGAVGFTTTNAEFKSDVQKQLTGIMANIITGKTVIPSVRTDRDAVNGVLSTVIKE